MKISRLPLAVAAVALLALSGKAAQAQSPVNLDFSTGTFTFGANQQYSQNGFTLATQAGNHFDVVGPTLAYHSGPANASLNFLTLTYGGSAFSLTSIDILSNMDGFVFQAAGYSDIVVNPGSTGTVNLSAFNNVTSVRIDYVTPRNFYPQEIDNLRVNTGPTGGTGVPEPGTMALLAGGLVPFAAVARRRKK